MILSGPKTIQPTKFPNRIRQNSSIIVFGLLVVGAIWIRFRLLGYTEVIHDQSRTLNMALEWIHGGDFPLVSDRTSLGVRNPPLNIYLYALGLVFDPSLWSVTYLLSGLSLLGIAFYGWALAQVLNWRVSWWVCALFSVLPWAVYYGRYIWQVSFVPIFATGLFACTILYLIHDPRPRWLMLGALFLAGTLQTHLTAFTLLPVLMLVGLVFRRKQLWQQWRWVIGAGGLVIASFTPYILFQIKTQFADWRIGQSGLEGHLDVNLTALELTLDLFWSRGIFGLAGSAREEWQAIAWFWQAGSELFTFWFSAALLALGAVLLAKPKSFTSPKLVLWITAVLWFVIPVLPFIPHTRLLHNYYFLHCLPAGFVIIVLLSEVLFEQALSIRHKLFQSSLGKWLASLAYVPLGLLLIQYTITTLTGQTIMASGLAGKQRAIETQAAIDTARRLAAQYPNCRLVVINEVPLWEDARFGLMREFVGKDRVSIIQDVEVNLWPTPCAIYFVASQKPNAAQWVQAQAQILPEATIHTPGETWEFYYLSPEARAKTVETLLTPVPLAVWGNGLELHKTTVSLGSQTGFAQLEYTWKVGTEYNWQALPASDSLRFGNQLLSSGGALISQVDGVTTDSREWKPGDVIVRQWLLPIPADVQLAGLPIINVIYTLPDIQRIKLLQPEGEYWQMPFPPQTQ